VELTTYLKTWPCSDKPDQLLVYATARGAVLELDRTVLDDAVANTLSSQEQELLTRLGILVPDRAAEQVQLRDIYVEANQRSQRFTALVTLNLDCNLACSYCFEDHFRGNYYMSQQTADQLVALLHRKIDAGMNVMLDFYGGEALLSLPLMRDIASRIKAHADQNTAQVSFNLVSNATLLTAPVARELQELGFKTVRFTLDGPPEVHNQQRPFVSGKGSFELILAHLDQVCDILSVQLGGNYTRDNYHLFPQLLDILLQRGITPGRLGSVQFSPITPKAGQAGMGDFAIGCACPNEPWLIEASLFLRQAILSRGFSTPKPKLASCMVEFSNDLVINYDGSLYKCPAFMGWKDMCIGTLSDGPSDYYASHNLHLWKNETCLNCPYLPLCFGGCRFLSRMRTGNLDDVDCRRDYLDASLEEIVRQDMAFKNRF